VIASVLQAERYDAVVAPTGEDGFFRANAEVSDLVSTLFDDFSYSGR